MTRNELAVQEQMSAVTLNDAARCVFKATQNHLWGCLRAGKPVSELNICTSQASELHWGQVGG